jgi:hypothetical protein
MFKLRPSIMERKENGVQAHLRIDEEQTHISRMIANTVKKSYTCIHTYPESPERLWYTVKSCQSGTDISFFSLH